MRIGAGAHTYEWIDGWARIPDTESGRANGRTHGVAVARDGRTFVFHQANPAMLVFDAAGQPITAWGDRFGGAHGLTLVEEDGVEFLWLVDQNSSEVVKTTLDGRTQTLARPDHPVYAKAKYVPTWVAVHEVRHGGNGDIWVADDYGASLVQPLRRHGPLPGQSQRQRGRGRPLPVSARDRLRHPQAAGGTLHCRPRQPPRAAES